LPDPPAVATAPTPVYCSRAERVRTSTLGATLELLAERGFAGLTVEGIAARAGVSKATIYRHWPTLPQLVLDAVTSCLEHAEPPDTGSLRGDLVEVLRRLVRTITSTKVGAVLPALVDGSERDPELADLHGLLSARRREIVKKVLHRGMERGEVRRDLDVDLTAELLAAPFFYRRLVARSPLARDLPERVVDALLPVIETRGGAAEPHR